MISLYKLLVMQVEFLIIKNEIGRLLRVLMRDNMYL